ncbi:MAG: A24 family peptidase [Bacillota bacterium]|nr:A24 family peptidase [Bacillota bacterium]
MAHKLFIFFGCLIPALACAVTDFRSRIIPNRITLPMLAAGFFYAVYAKNLPDGLLGFAFAGGVLLVCALMGGAGGGDLKLAAALGAWFGFRNALWILFIGSFIGVVWGSWNLARQGRLKARMLLFFRGLFLETVYGMKGTAILPKLPEDPEAPVPPEAVPFGTCLAAAAWAVWGVRLLVG